MNENTFKNHRILVKRITDGKVVADTRIKRYEPVTNSFVISADSLTEKSYYQVTAMVFGEDDLYEFEGSIKGTVIENEVEISLGKRRKKEDRKRPRYHHRSASHDGVLRHHALPRQTDCLTSYPNKPDAVS